MRYEQAASFQGELAGIPCRISVDRRIEKHPDPRQKYAFELRVDFGENSPLLCLDSVGVRAWGFLRKDGKFVILKGSQAVRPLPLNTRPIARSRRRELIKQGLLKKRGEMYEFLDNHCVSTPSGAVGILIGGKESGGSLWKDHRGRELKEIVDS